MTNMRHNKIKLSTMLLLGYGLTGLYAQEVLPATGGNASGSGGSVSYTVGQVMYTTNTGTNGSVAQGVQQPYEISVVNALDQTNDITLQCLVFPNPTTDYLILKVENYENFNLSDLTISLYDTSGKLAESKKIYDSETSIIMNNLAPATYFLKVYTEERNDRTGVRQGNKEVKTFKIVKNK